MKWRGLKAKLLRQKIDETKRQERNSKDRSERDYPSIEINVLF